MSTKPAQSPKPTRWQVWRRRTRRTVYTILIIAIIFRAILFFALPPVLHKVAAAYGFTATYDRQELTLVSGDVGLWGLKIYDESGGQPVFSADYIRGNISPLALLEGRLYIRRAEVDGSDIILDRTQGGRIPLLEHLITSSTTPAPQPIVSSGPLSFDFNPTLAVEAFRLSHVRVKIMDESVQPPFQATVAMDFRINDFGIRDKPTSFEIDSWSDPALDLLRIYGQSTSTAQSLHATATLTMHGLHPRSLAGYLLPMGIRPVGSNLTGNFDADLKIAPATAPDKGISLALTVQRIGLWSDEQPALSVSNFAITANAVTPQRILLNTLDIDGVQLTATRSGPAGVEFAGFGLGSPPPTTQPSSTQPASAPSLTSPSPFGLDLREVALTNLDFEFRDTVVSPPNDLHLSIPQFGAKFDPTTNTAPIAGTITFPGVIGSINFSGTASKPDRNMTLKMTAVGIRPDAIKSYLGNEGIESLWSSGSLITDMTADLRNDAQGDLVADAACGPITLTDGNDLFTFKNLALRGAGLDSQSGRIKIESIQLSGPDLQINRDSSGRVTLANFRWTPSQFITPPPPPSQNSSILGSLGLPRFEIGEFLWSQPNIVFHDDFAQPAITLTLNDAGIDVKNFRFDLDADGPAEDGTITGWLKWPNPSGQVTLTGTTHSLRDLFHTDLALRAQGLALADLAPFTKTLGFEPTIQNGSFQLDAAAEVARTNGTPLGSLNINNVSFHDGKTELAGLDSVQVAGVHFDPLGMDVKSVAVSSPKISAGRDSDGVLRIAGIRILPTDQTSTGGLFNPPQAFGLADFDVMSAQVLWNDLATKQPVNAILRTDIHLGGMSRDPAAPPASYRIESKIDGSPNDLLISGTIDAHPDHPSLTAQLAATGFGAAITGAYLPPGDIWALKAGQFRVVMEAAAPVIPAGGRSLNLNVHDLDWRDGPTGTPILQMGSFKIVAPRVDPVGGVIAIDQISLNGVKTEAQLDPQGNLHVLGITFTTAPPTPSRPTTQPSTIPTRRVSAPASLSALIARPNQTVPHLTIADIDLNLDQISLRNMAQPAAVPLALSNIRLHNPDPIDLGGTTPYSTPTKLQLTGSISPIVGNFTVNITAAPLQQQPVLTADLSVTGIRGQGVTDVAPQFSDILDGSGMTDGRITASAKATVDFSRHGPRDFNLMRGFKLNGYLRNLEMRDSPSGPVLAGLAAVYLQDATIKPATGLIAVKTLNIQTPQAYIYRDSAGIHICGIAIGPRTPPPPPPPKPAAQPPPRKIGVPPPRKITSAPARSAAADPPPSDPPPSIYPSPPPTSEFRIDDILVSGLNVRIEDRLASPVFVAPLNGLDAEVRDLTTRAFTEPKIIRFNALLTAGKVPIPATKPPQERTFFSQAAAVGKISLYPQTDGYAKLSLNGVELAALRNVAREQGVNLTRGTLDADIDLRPQTNNTVDANCRFVFTDLQISEPANGPIARTLLLPAPLDTVIGALQAPDGSITIPISFPLKNGEISKSAIVAGVAGATGPIIATAIASAPLKLAGGFVGILGIGGGNKGPRSQTYEVDFAPGSANLDVTNLALVQSLVMLAHRDPTLQFTIRQELGTQDVQLASQRANPAPADAMAMIQELKQRRADLLDQRARLAGFLRGQLAALSSDNSDQTIVQLRRLERELADVETASDELYNLLSPGADRQAARRTRGAAVEIARRRLDAVSDLFRQRLQSYDQRVRVIAPQYNPGTNEAGRVYVTVIYGK
jgi:hypothetical protein